MTNLLRNPFRFLLGGTVGAAAGAAYMGYSSFRWVFNEVRDLEVRVTEAEKRLGALEEKVDSNETRSQIRMDVLETKMEEYKMQLMAEMEMMKKEFRLAGSGQGVKAGAAARALPEPTIAEQVKMKRPMSPPPTPKDS